MWGKKGNLFSKPIKSFFLAILALFWVAKTSPAAEQVVVKPGDTADLYQKLNQTQTAGHVLLVSGTYVLDAALGDAAGPATQGGYIYLGDRHLKGTNVFTDTDGDGIPDPIGVDGGTGQAIYFEPGEETVIDGSGIPLDPVEDRIVVAGPDGFASIPFNRPLIWAPEGNVIEGITVRWAPPSEEDPIGLTFGTINLRGGTGGRVSACLVENGDMGINFANIGKENSGTLLTAEAIGNVLRGNVRHGIGVFTFGNRNAQVKVGLKGNRSTENGGGGLAFGNLTCRSCSIHVSSQENIYQSNTLGIFTPGSAIMPGPTESPSSDNQSQLHSGRDSFEDNVVGIVAFGALRFDDASPYTADNNTTSLNLHETRFSGNSEFTIQPNDVGDSNTGSGNRLMVLVRKAVFESGGPSLAVRATPGENQLILPGNAVAWEKTNGGLPIPIPPPGENYEIFTGKGR